MRLLLWCILQSHLCVTLLQSDFTRGLFVTGFNHLRRISVVESLISLRTIIIESTWPLSDRYKARICRIPAEFLTILLDFRVDNLFTGTYKPGDVDFRQKASDTKFHGSDNDIHYKRGMWWVAAAKQSGVDQEPRLRPKFLSKPEVGTRM